MVTTIIQFFNKTPSDSSVLSVSCYLLLPLFEVENVCFLSLKGRAVSFREDHLIFVIPLGIALMAAKTP